MESTHPSGTVALLAPMPAELRPIVKRARLRPVAKGRPTTYAGTVGSTAVVAARIGMGTANAAEATGRVIDDHEPVHVVVVGVAGGVGPGRRIGDLIVAQEHIDHDTGTVFRAHPFGGLEPTGRSFTTNELLVDPDVRRREVPAGVEALDMENTAVAAVCEEHGVAWTAIRVLSDHVDEGIVDEEIIGLNRHDGTPDPGAVARYVLRRPWRLPRLARLGRDLNRAANAAAGVAVEACRAHDAGQTPGA